MRNDHVAIVEVEQGAPIANPEPITVYARQPYHVRVAYIRLNGRQGVTHSPGHILWYPANVPQRCARVSNSHLLIIAKSDKNTIAFSYSINTAARLNRKVIAKKKPGTVIPGFPSCDVAVKSYILPCTAGGACR